MKNIITLVVFGMASALIGAASLSLSLKSTGAIPTKYETGEIIKNKGRVFILIEYRPIIPEEVSK